MTAPARTRPCTQTGCRHPDCAALGAAPARAFRAALVYDWVMRTFGGDNAVRSERIDRFVEEALELAQACGMPAARVTTLLAHVYGKPVGTVAQEIGGVGMTLLALGRAHDIDPEQEEVRELLRVLALDPAHFRARHNRKADAGVATRVDTSTATTTVDPKRPEAFDLERRAFQFAIERHQGQKYGEGAYEIHLSEVVAALEEHGINDPVFLAAGWLHDVLEDTPTTKTELVDRFGGPVADLVWACSGVGTNRKARNMDIAAKLRAHPAAVVVKLADRLANVRASTPGSRHRAMYEKEWPAFWEALYAASQRHAPHAIANGRMWTTLIELLGEPSNVTSCVDPWHQTVREWILNEPTRRQSESERMESETPETPGEFTIGDILRRGLQIHTNQHTAAMYQRVRSILLDLRFASVRRRMRGGRSIRVWSLAAPSAEPPHTCREESPCEACRRDALETDGLGIDPDLSAKAIAPHGQPFVGMRVEAFVNGAEAMRARAAFVCTSLDHIEAARAIEKLDPIWCDPPKDDETPGTETCTKCGGAVVCGKDCMECSQ